MRKSRDKKRRSVYPYRCRSCGNKRIAFDFERAKVLLCRKCERDAVPEGQFSIFDVVKDKAEGLVVGPHNIEQLVLQAKAAFAKKGEVIEPAALPAPRHD